MKFMNRPSLFSRTAPWTAIAVLIWASALAKEDSRSYLNGVSADPTSVLAPPPAAGSPEEGADLQSVREVVQSAESNSIVAALSEKKFSCLSFTPAIGQCFESGKLPKTERFLEHVQEDASAIADEAKEHWKRPRPYSVDTNLAAGKLEKTFSYPSGHSTEGTALALVLADLFPDKREAILAEGRAIGWHRVQLGRHYPTDIYAGRVLAQAIVQEMKKNKRFEKDFAEAKAEIAAAKH